MTAFMSAPLARRSAGPPTGAGNIISGNTRYGVAIEASSCLVEGNDIGTNAAGTAAVANYDGICVGSTSSGGAGSGATIGGTGAGAGNTISGNSHDGIYVLASCLVVGNEIGTNSKAGIDVTSGATATITNDSITGDGTGILVGSGASDTCLVTAQDDDLSGNTTAGITNNQTNSSYAVTATDDWWGSLHGPTTTANPGGNGTSVSSNVNFSPWIGVYTPGTGAGFQPTGHHPLRRADPVGLRHRAIVHGPTGGGLRHPAGRRGRGRQRQPGHQLRRRHGSRRPGRDDPQHALGHGHAGGHNRRSAPRAASPASAG